MIVGFLLFVCMIGMALTTKEPSLRKRRLALCGAMALIAIAVRLLHVQF